MFFSASTMIDVAREQQKDRLREAQKARLLQLAAASQPKAETQRSSKFNHTLELIGWHFKRQLRRI